MTRDDSVVIAAAARTPMGAFQGGLSTLSASDLGAAAIRAAVERSRLDPELVDEVLIGCVLSAGQGQAPARQAAIKAGLPLSAGATTINKMCGSGMKAVMLGSDLIRSGSAAVVIAGGMESMSNAPYLLKKARTGLRMGHGSVLDHMFLDGLEDAYEHGRLMGTFAEDCAQAHSFSRQAQDEFALSSLSRAQAAIVNGSFIAEVCPVEVEVNRATRSVSFDEQPSLARPDKIPSLRPAFREGGTITAANASSISDGAAAIVLTSRREAERQQLTPLARIVGHATYAGAPADFPTAPIGAIRKLCDALDWQPGEVDLYEINEAFAVVTMATMRALDLPHDKVNIHGGACALGHPIGASGARVLVTLLNALRSKGLCRGIASLCIGGGEATAMAIELIG
ncbi:acetyl-CoA C-acyltransferase [Rhizobium lemnae]|uniref:Acetyl-CoA C-acyltransferase n=1 Tax=Rhizobium lemnae TaxID=1214924 RepID=A0ABV8E521_9HYPH|nr:acetyl-CoA C-acyltransferase [Rhizobium lemnae]MCJ8509431.1 acetyl-CoA C-acyltransferase [Rhizobium lemnae]